MYQFKDLKLFLITYLFENKTSKSIGIERYITDIDDK